MLHGRVAWILLLATGFLAGDPGAAQAESPNRRELALRELTEVLHVLHERYGEEVSYRDLNYAAIAGMLRTLDPHTSFLPPRAYEGMRQRQQGSFYGLGILVSMRNGHLTVIAPIEGTPASRLGMRPGDVIQTIEGEPTAAMSLDEAVGKLKGPKGTEVDITIVRRGLEEPLPLTVPRAEIPQTTVRYAYMMTPEVGYLRLTDFSRSTAEEMEEALARLRREGMKKLLLDLRSNGGGLLDQVVAVADMFLPAGSEIVATRGRLRDSSQEFLDDDDDPDPELDLPLVVLVNNGTASAAEILAGAIQDHDVGLIVGLPTWGKGLVQTVYNLSYGAGISLTTARYHTPSGRVIQRDYTSYYDYYTQYSRSGDERDPAAADQQAFLTDLGRTVHGGGGITPDVVVEIAVAPAALQFLFAKNAFFDFAVDFQRRHPVPDETWQPGEEILDEFAGWLRERGIGGDEIEEKLGDEAVREFSRRQIHADIFTAAFGVEAAHRVVAAGDVQIQTGLELFDQAADLLSRREQLEGDAAQPQPRPQTAARRPPTPGAPAVPVPRPEYWPPELRASARFAQAKLLADGGSFREALRTYREAIAEDESDAYLRIELANFLVELAELWDDDEKKLTTLEKAAREASVARQLEPGDPAILGEFAAIHLRLGEHQSAALDIAQEAFETLREMTPEDLRVLTSLGQIYLWKQEHARAVEVLRAADSYLPNHRTIQQMLAEALSGAGQPEGAELDPD